MELRQTTTGNHPVAMAGFPELGSGTPLQVAAARLFLVWLADFPIKPYLIRDLSENRILGPAPAR